MRQLVFWICAVAAVFVVSAFISGVVHGCERYHDDGVALWCCPGEAGACVFVAWADEGLVS